MRRLLVILTLAFLVVGFASCSSNGERKKIVCVDSSVDPEKALGETLFIEEYEDYLVVYEGNRKEMVLKKVSSYSPVKRDYKWVGKKGAYVEVSVYLLTGDMKMCGESPDKGFSTMKFKIRDLNN